MQGSGRNQQMAARLYAFIVVGFGWESSTNVKTSLNFQFWWFWGINTQKKLKNRKIAKNRDSSKIA